MASFRDRVVGALTIQASTFEEVEHDKGATGQAAAVVAVAAIARGLAAARGGGLGIIPVMLVLALLGWVIGSFVLMVVGTRLLPGKDTQADLGELLRTTGFAQAAGLVGIVGIVPFFGLITSLVVGIWILIAMVVAVRQALDYEDTTKAVLVCLVAWVIMFVVSAVAGLIGIGGGVLATRVM